MAEVTGPGYKALKSTYKVEELPRFEHLLRSIAVKLCTGVYFKHRGEHAQMKFRACSSSFGPGTFVSNGTAVTCYGQYPLI
jgi:hypothetical protein